MERKRCENDGAHILAIPYMIPGHLNPLVQFLKRLAFKAKAGLTITLLIPSSTLKFSTASLENSKIRVEYIDDYGSKLQGETVPLDARLKHFTDIISQSLSQTIKRLSLDDLTRPKVLIYDSIMPWALDVALDNGLHAAPFFTQPCAVNAVYYLVHHGLEIPIRGSVDSPPLAMLQETDMPSMATNHVDLYPNLQKLVADQFVNFRKAKWHLVNSILELEEEAVKWMKIQNKCPILTIGPTAPSMYLDKRFEDDEDYALSLILKPDVEAHMKWLDSKEPGSVIYASFGSLAELREEQIEEIAWGLKNSNHHFLWVVRECEKTKLPLNFLDETSEKGLVLSWCSQLQVLSHKAVGCFLTHCGWNSTLEALSLGVPMVAMPQWADQPTNAKFIADVWKVGVRVRVDEKGIGRREEVEICVREIMEGEKGKEIRNNSFKLRDLVKQSIGESGSSDRNIDEFIASVKSA